VYNHDKIKQDRISINEIIKQQRAPKIFENLITNNPSKQRKNKERVHREKDSGKVSIFGRSNPNQRKKYCNNATKVKKIICIIKI